MRRIIAAFGLMAVISGLFPGAPFALPITEAPKAQAAQTLVTADDVQYLGYYTVYLNEMGLDNPFGQGLTGRYVNGDFRLMYLNIWNQIKEFSLAGKSYGQQINTSTGTWSTGFNFGGKHNGIWWDEAGQRLWTTSAIDYIASQEQVQITQRRLNSDGTSTVLAGPVGIQGQGAKRVYGGVQAVPSWFQQQYNVKPYVAGWGGYSSLVCTGTAALGPTMYSIPDISTYAANAEIPTNNYKTLIDTSSGTCQQDWYENGTPTTYDRGVRKSLDLENYFDGGDTRPNGSCATCNGSRPTNPPLSNNWSAPAPDGLGRWTWGDSYYNTGMWIDTPTKKGFVAVASLAKGKAWYCSSTLCYDNREHELHVYDPAKIGEAAQGTRPVWNVKPSSMKILSLPELASPSQGNGVSRNVGGATFDPVTGRIYMMGYGIGYANRLYVFQVNGAGTNEIPTPTPVPPPPPVSPTPTPTPTPTVTCSTTVPTNSFNACYYDNADLTNPVLNRTDNAINFEWGTGSPGSAVAADTFSAKWEGNFSFDAASYTFTITNDDGMRLYVDDQLVVNKWVDQSQTTTTGTKTLTAGTHKVRVEYFENSGDAVAKASWTKGAATTPPPPPPVVNPVPPPVSPTPNPPPPPPSSGGGGGGSVSPSPTPTPTPTTTVTRHPRGTMVVNRGTIYFLGTDLRYPFPSADVFLSWGASFSDVVEANSADMKMPVGPVVQFKTSTETRHPRTSLVNHNGTIYFLGEKVRYPFPSAEVFLSWGVRFDQVVPANSGDIAMPIGPVVEMKK